MSTARSRTVAQRATMVVVLAVVSFHMLSTFLYAAPSSSLSQEAAPVTTAHMRPLFGQNWQIFAPDPQSVDLRVWVRASTRDAEGTESVTEWVNLGDVFNEQVRHQILPTRTWRIPVSVNRFYTSAYGALVGQQQAVVQSDHVASAEGGQGRQDLTKALLGTGASVSGIDSYLLAEDALYLFGTQAALDLWPDAELVAIQMSTSTQGVVPFEQRLVPGVQRPEEQFTRLGWRDPSPVTPEARAGFSSVFGGWVS
ncbi:DUF5819 family protein [Oerskovia enterophila]|uniref:DUF5819 family protein n=1 Tax=Oerskovia enterophila TaxID=43678 RepID=UPI0033934609